MLSIMLSHREPMHKKHESTSITIVFKSNNEYKKEVYDEESTGWVYKIERYYLWIMRTGNDAENVSVEKYDWIFSK